MALWRHIYILPLIVFFGFVVTFFTTYAIAVTLGHVKPNIPYISDSGTCPPESCIFGQLMNITALMLGVTVYVRYSMVEDYYCSGRHRTRWERLCNQTALVFGLFGAFGISIVGNFQETAMLGVHLFGAMLAFFLGTFYCWLQVPITYYTRPDMTHPCMLWLRLIMAVLCTLFFITGWLCAAFTPSEFSVGVANAIKLCNASEVPNSTWGRANHGWEWHVCSTASEWLIALLFSLTLLTFAYEFRLVTIVKPKLIRVVSVRCHHHWVPIDSLQTGHRRSVDTAANAVYIEHNAQTA